MLSACMLVAPLLLGQSAVTLRFMPPVGKSYRYQMHMTTSQSMGAQKMDAATDAEASIKVVSRKGDVSTLETTINKAKMTFPKGSPMAGNAATIEKSMNGKKSTTQVDSHYKPVSTGSGAMNQMFGSYQFPTKPVHVGESWSFTMKLPMPSMSGTIPVKMTLVGVSGNIATLKVAVAGKVAMGGGPQGQSISLAISGGGNSTFEISTGMFTGMDMTTVTKAEGSMPFNMNMRQTMKRL